MKQIVLAIERTLSVHAQAILVGEDGHGVEGQLVGLQLLATSFWWTKEGMVTHGSEDL